MSAVKLYKKDSKGKLRFWSAYAENGFVTVASGIVGMEQTSTVQEQYQCEPTNVGKKNERNRTQQAIFEVNALYKAKLEKKGYKRSPGETDEVSEAVMLAQDATKGKNLDKIEWGRVDGQMKLNGVRCRIRINDDGSYTAFSRQNKVYTLPPTLDEEIKNKILTMDMRVKQLDGELYIHGVEFENIVRMVKDVKNPERDRLEFHWYDVIGTQLDWDTRKSLIKGFGSRIIEVPYEPLASIEEAREMLKRANQSGYEGLMLRNWAGLYACGQRSYNLQKWKTFDDAEFKCVGIEVDKRGHAVFVFEVEPGKNFNARWKATDEQRKHAAEHPEEYVEKMWTVVFQNYSIYGIPIFPVCTVMRDYE